MRRFAPIGLALVTLGLGAEQGVHGQTRSVAAQVVEAVNPLNEADQAGATVLGYRSGTTLEVLRQGTNQYVCLADMPGDQRFQVSCYHKDLDPFMARGRELAAMGKDMEQRRRIRIEEIEAGTLPMPKRAMLISLYGIGDLDTATGLPDSVATLRVLYLPYANAQETGLDERPSRTSPYLMGAGTAWAHLMLPGERRRFRP